MGRGGPIVGALDPRVLGKNDICSQDRTKIKNKFVKSLKIVGGTE